MPRGVPVGGRRTGTGFYGPPDTKSSGSGTKKTGRANAITRGKGKKKGLKK
jgi:hypothetical protein